MPQKIGAFTKRLREWRWQAGDGTHPLSVADTARVFGVSRVTMTSWLKGDAVPSLANAAKAADVFGITLDELAGRTNRVSTKNQGKKGAQ